MSRVKKATTKLTIGANTNRKSESSQSTANMIATEPTKVTIVTKNCGSATLRASVISVKSLENRAMSSPGRQRSNSLIGKRIVRSKRRMRKVAIRRWPLHAVR
jgi:hypothetical protein